MFIYDFIITILTTVFLKIQKFITVKIYTKHLLKRELRALKNHQDFSPEANRHLQFDWPTLFKSLEKYLLNDIDIFTRSLDSCVIKQRTATIAKNVLRDNEIHYNNPEVEYIERFIAAFHKRIDGVYIQQNDMKILATARTILANLERNTVETINDNEFDKIVESRKETILNRTIFPWFRDSLKYYEVFPDLFVTPTLSKRECESSLDDILSNYTNYNIAILGEAGAGKSTLFRYLFTNSNKYCFFYMHASEIMQSSNPIIQSIFQPNTAIDFKKPLIILLDGIDEIYSNNPRGYLSLVNLINNNTVHYFWIASRTDFFEQMQNENTKFTKEEFILQPWNTKQSDSFINTYSRIIKCDDINEKINRIVPDLAMLKQFKQNPFKLAILVFLAGHADNIQVQGMYGLYSTFIQHWIEREINRETSINAPSRITDELLIAARYIYNGQPYKISEFTEENTAVSHLLHISEANMHGEKYAYTFYHKSLAAFLLAENTLSSMLSGDFVSLEINLSCALKDDVTNFVNEAVSFLGISEKEKIFKNLSAYNSQLDHNASVAIKQQIIYYASRLDIDVSNFLLNELSLNPTNLIMRLALAYSCALSNNPDTRAFALEYAKSIANGSEDAVTNRAWTVVYFGDVISDPYTYKDDEQCQWSKARQARIKRFIRSNPRVKDYRFRLFDVPLFYSFLSDRGWNDLSWNEYNILADLKFPDQYFYPTEQEFLSEELSKLLKEYHHRLELQKEGA